MIHFNLKEERHVGVSTFGICMYIYLIVVYYLCLTTEMPDLPDMEEEC